MLQEEVHPANQYHMPRIKSCSRVSPTAVNRATKALVSVCSENGVWNREGSHPPAVLKDIQCFLHDVESRKES